MDDANLDTLNTANWDEIVPALTRYAHLKVALRRRVLGRMAIPTELGPDDFVQQAVESVFMGTRIWNKEAYPTLLEFMKNVVDSMLSNWGRSSAFKSQQTTVSLESNPELTHTASISPERWGEIENALYDLLDGRDDAEELFAVLEGELDDKKRSEIADEWNMTVEAVTNARKRLFRLIESEFDHNLLDNLD